MYFVGLFTQKKSWLVWPCVGSFFIVLPQERENSETGSDHPGEILKTGNVCV